MLRPAVRPLPLRILAAPGQWPLLPPEAERALQSAATVVWHPGADPSLLAMLGPHQRQCELSHDPEVPSAFQRASNSSGENLVLLQPPGAATPVWAQDRNPSLSRFNAIELPSITPSCPKVILTRAHPHNLEVAKTLLQNDVSSVSLPTLAFGPAPDPELVQRSLSNLANFFGIIVSSPRTVQTLNSCQALPPSTKVVAIGASTAAALSQHKLPCHLAPALAHSEGLVAELRDQNWLAKPWLHLRGDTGRDVIQRAISDAGGRYTLVPCYQSLKPRLAPPLLRASQSPELKLICFASGQSYFNYKAMLGRQHSDKEVDAHLKKLRILSFGPVTSQAILQDGHQVSIELAQPNAQLQIKAILEGLGVP